MFILLLLLVVIVFVIFKFVNNKNKKTANFESLKAACLVADSFLKDGGSNSFSLSSSFTTGPNGRNISLRDFKVEVDTQNQLIILNGNVKISPAEFSWSWGSTKKTVSYNTGGNRDVTGNSGAKIGTVNVPGQSGRYAEVTGGSFKFFRSGEEVLEYIIDDGNDVRFKEPKRGDFGNGLSIISVLHRIEDWSAPIVQEAAANSLKGICAKAGLQSADAKTIFKNDKTGALREAFAVNGESKAVAIYDNGAENWSGSLKGASAQIVDDKLEIKVDDPVYREKHLSERRFSILAEKPREVLIEWEERINLLAKKAATA